MFKGNEPSSVDQQVEKLLHPVPSHGGYSRDENPLAYITSKVTAKAPLDAVDRDFMAALFREFISVDETGSRMKAE